MVTYSISQQAIMKNISSVTTTVAYFTEASERKQDMNGQ
jgi:hypothetical protein